MWKSTWTYTKDVYHMDEELGPEIKTMRPSEAQAMEDFEGIEEFDTLGGKGSQGVGRELDPWAEDVQTRELDPWAEDVEMELDVDIPAPVEVEEFDWWMYDGEVQDARTLVKQIDWGDDTLAESQWNETLDELENPDFQDAFLEDVEVLEELPEIGVESGLEILEVGAELDFEFAEVAVAVAESLEITGEVIVAGAVAGAIAGAVATAAVVLGATFAGMYILKWVKKHTLPQIADNDAMMGLVGYVVLGKVWLPCHINEIVDIKKKGKYAWIEFVDMIQFYHEVQIKVDDPTLQLLSPPTRSGFLQMTPKFLDKHKKLIDLPFYVHIMVGTRVKLTTPYNKAYAGKEGTIRRGFVYTYKDDGTNNKYKIQIDGVIDQYYESVQNFDVYDAKLTKKHYPKSKRLHWLNPPHKSKWYKKQKIKRDTLFRKLRSIHANQTAEHTYSFKYLDKYFDTKRRMAGSKRKRDDVDDPDFGSGSPQVGGAVSPGSAYEPGSDVETESEIDSDGGEDDGSEEDILAQLDTGPKYEVLIEEIDMVWLLQRCKIFFDCVCFVFFARRSDASYVTDLTTPVEELTEPQAQFRDDLLFLSSVMRSDRKSLGEPIWSAMMTGQPRLLAGKKVVVDTRNIFFYDNIASGFQDKWSGLEKFGKKPVAIAFPFNIMAMREFGSGYALEQAFEEERVHLAGFMELGTIDKRQLKNLGKRLVQLHGPLQFQKLFKDRFPHTHDGYAIPRLDRSEPRDHGKADEMYLQNGGRTLFCNALMNVWPNGVKWDAREGKETTGELMRSYQMTRSDLIGQALCLLVDTNAKHDVSEYFVKLQRIKGSSRSATIKIKLPAILTELQFSVTSNPYLWKWMWGAPYDVAMEYAHSILHSREGKAVASWSMDKKFSVMQNGFPIDREILVNERRAARQSSAPLIGYGTDTEDDVPSDAESIKSVEISRRPGTVLHHPEEHFEDYVEPPQPADYIPKPPKNRPIVLVPPPPKKQKPPPKVLPGKKLPKEPQSDPETEEEVVVEEVRPIIVTEPVIEIKRMNMFDVEMQQKGYEWDEQREGYFNILTGEKWNPISIVHIPAPQLPDFRLPEQPKPLAIEARTTYTYDPSDDPGHLETGTQEDGGGGGAIGAALFLLFIAFMVSGGREGGY